MHQITPFLVREARIQFKFRELKIGDGFPSSKSISNLTKEYIQILNKISYCIGRCIHTYTYILTYIQNNTIFKIPILNLSQNELSFAREYPYY